MKFLILILLFFNILQADIKILIYGLSLHSKEKYTYRIDWYDEAGNRTYSEKEDRAYNSNHDLLGIEYELLGYSISAVKYYNSFHRWTNGFYVSKLWNFSEFNLKINAGVANGYTAIEKPEVYRPLISPSITKSFEDLEIEVGILGNALFAMLKLNLGGL